jgi:hypothetical protein
LLLLSSSRIETIFCSIRLWIVYSVVNFIITLNNVPIEKKDNNVLADTSKHKKVSHRKKKNIRMKTKVTFTQWSTLQYETTSIIWWLSRLGYPPTRRYMVSLSSCLYKSAQMIVSSGTYIKMKQYGWDSIACTEKSVCVCRMFYKNR